LINMLFFAGRSSEKPRNAAGERSKHFIFSPLFRH
jgi:hypothetical protein